MAAELGGLGRRELEARVGSVADAFGPRLATLASGPARGLRSVELTTGSGLDATLLPDRGGDLFSLRWRGVPLGFHGSPGPGSAAYYRPEERGWLHTFSGFVETCGLRNAGVPSGGHGLHGQICARPRRHVVGDGRVGGRRVRQHRRDDAPRGGRLRREPAARAHLARAPGRRLDRAHGHGHERRLRARAAHAALPHQRRLPAAGRRHRARARRRADRRATRRPRPAPRTGTAWARHGRARRKRSSSSSAPRARASPARRWAARSRIEWDAAQLPFATEWKCLASGTYALGIEPGTCHPIGVEAAVAAGQPPILEPGASHTASLRLRVEPL